ncbi:MAG: hypothetical protein K9L02_03855 [Acholeplasmataceae bacterium]|nr:hypothetical protein [Acholeplasmataceae bacterium]
MNSSAPVYNFLGYHLLQAQYYRKLNSGIEKFSIKMTDHSYNKKTKNYVINFKIFLKFNDIIEESVFEFEGGFHINDEKWKDEITSNMLNSLFFSVIFPYVRNKIYSITDDINTGVQLPIIDLRGVDLTKDTIFYSNREKK